MDDLQWNYSMNGSKPSKEVLILSDDIADHKGLRKNRIFGLGGISVPRILSL